MIAYIFLSAFFIVAGLNLFATKKENKKLNYITKPLLMPMLALFYVFGVPIATVNWLIVAGLIFGTMGDIFLMLEEKWFIYGMGAFLVNQILYTIAFFLSITNIAAFPIWGLFLLAPVLLILYFNMPKFMHKLGELKIPVYVYMVVILIMHISALLTLAEFNGLPFIFIYLGSLLYVFSDSFVAIEAFEKETPQAGLIAMATYILCQLYITLGAVFISLI